MADSPFSLLFRTALKVFFVIGLVQLGRLFTPSTLNCMLLIVVKSPSFFNFFRSVHAISFGQKLISEAEAAVIDENAKSIADLANLFIVLKSFLISN